MSEEIQSLKARVAELEEQIERMTDLLTDQIYAEAIAECSVRYHTLVEAIRQKVVRREHLAVLRDAEGEELYALACRAVAEDLTEILIDAGEIAGMRWAPEKRRE